MKKKIAIINSVCGTGSTGRICSELSSFLEKQNFETLICFGRNENKYKRQNAFCFSNDFEIKLHGTKARLLDKSGYGSKHATRLLIKKLESFNPDLIILHNLHGYYLNVFLLLKWIATKNIKTISVFHDAWNFTGHCAFFDFVDCKKWMSLCHNCPNKLNYPKSLFFDNSKNNFLNKKKAFSSIPDLTVVVPSQWLFNLVKKSYFSNRNVLVINNGIDTHVFKKVNSNVKEKLNIIDKKIIICVANVFNEKKGINDIYNLSEVIGEDEVIIVVGKIEKKNNKKRTNIIFIERTENQKELIELYSCADVFFNPTYEDNYPTVNLEAVACGLPIISYNTGGATEVVDENFVVQKGDYMSAYKLMSKIFKKEIKYKYLDPSNLSNTEMHGKYLQLINKILER